MTTTLGSRDGYNIPIGRLRAFVTALVVAHHAVLAYYPWAPPPPATLLAQPRWWQAFPVVDAKRWTGWALFVGWNDIFFMALMFLLSGLFVWSSLQRKGSGGFLRQRVVRLGLPFVIAAGLLGPLAYYPTYLQSASSPTPAGFWEQWLALGNWPAGPAWFLWMLLAFGSAAAVLFRLAPHWAESAHRVAAKVLRSPWAFFGALTGFSALAYVPMAMSFGSLDWKSWGPFTFQTSRILFYAVYFGAGIILGAGEEKDTVLSPAGSLAKRWLLWPVAAAATFFVATAVTIMAITHPTASHSLEFLGDLAFALSCAASVLALLSVFLRFAKSHGPLRDSVCAVAYGIYIIHYPIVTWLQYFLLRSSLDAISKGIIVFAAAVISSWIVIALARRWRPIASVI